MPDTKRILIAPLDWGLGHATRCIPIINEIISLGHEVVIATDGRAYNLIKSEFPEQKLIRLKGYNPIYPKNGSMVFKMMLQVPKFLFAIAREHYQLKKIIREFSIDAIISDNRYGLWSDKITSVLMTHQIFIKMPVKMKWLEPAVSWLNHFFIKQFDHCWVPDEEGEINLSGELSHGKMPANVEYIGLLSRFHTLKEKEVNHRYDLLASLSGPEPQRTILEEEIIRQSSSSNIRTLIVRGVTEENRHEKLNDFIEMASHLKSKPLVEAFKQSKSVICRAGYSSLMELISLQKKAIIIPTPGQTEQEYLAERCGELNYFFCQKQSAINLKSGLIELDKTSPPEISVNSKFQVVLIKLISLI